MDLVKDRTLWALIDQYAEMRSYWFRIDSEGNRERLTKSYSDLKKYMSKKEAENVRPWIDVDLGVAHSTPGIGIAGLWQLPLTHPFFRCACYHDSMYDLMASGKAPYPTSKPVDDEFLRQCLERCDGMQANDFILYRSEAYFFYGQCRVWGTFRWKEEGWPEVIAKIKEAQSK